MEQKAKQEWWSKYGDIRNPYDELPDMTIYTYDLNKVFTDSSYIDLEDKAFNFKEFLEFGQEILKKILRKSQKARKSENLFTKKML